MFHKFLLSFLLWESISTWLAINCRRSSIQLRSCALKSFFRRCETLSLFLSSCVRGCVFLCELLNKGLTLENLHISCLLTLSVDVVYCVGSSSLFVDVVYWSGLLTLFVDGVWWCCLMTLSEDVVDDVVCWCCFWRCLFTSFVTWFVDVVCLHCLLTLFLDVVSGRCFLTFWDCLLTFFLDVGRECCSWTMFVDVGC